MATTLHYEPEFQSAHLFNSEEVEEEEDFSDWILLPRPLPGWDTPADSAPYTPEEFDAWLELMDKKHEYAGTGEPI